MDIITVQLLGILAVKNSDLLMSIFVLYPLHSISSYPTSRVQEDANGVEMGVIGSVSLLQNITLSSQPICGFDWSADKEGVCVCTSFDQMLRVLLVTKLNRV